MKKSKTNQDGFTIVEMAITMLISTIIILAAATVMGSSQQGWNRLWNSIHSKIRSDSDNFGITFGIIGRKTNRAEYKLYTVNNNSYTKAVPTSTPAEQVVLGDAVEFVYWDQELDATDSHNLIDTTKKGTAYAFFYLDGSDLKVDYGSYPPGAINGSSRRNPDSTIVIAENVSELEFNHTTVNGTGNGCVRATIEFTNPENNNITTIKASTYLRNAWPR